MQDLRNHPSRGGDRDKQEPILLLDHSIETYDKIPQDCLFGGMGSLAPYTKEHYDSTQETRINKEPVVSRHHG